MASPVVSEAAGSEASEAYPVGSEAVASRAALAAVAYPADSAAVDLEQD